MAKVTSQFVCQQCGAAQAKWAGRCGSCGAWDSLVETATNNGGRSSVPAPTAVKLSQVDSAKRQRIDTGVSQLNEVLGGGLVPGSVNLLSGDPGIGKSTLVLQLAAHLAAAQPVLYVSGEESAAQIKLRAERLGLGHSQLDLICDTSADAAAAAIDSGNYALTIVDSIQTLSTAALTGAAGSAGQITASAQLLTAAAKRQHTAVIIIGHVTKEGLIAGPKLLEHLVDVVLYLEGDRQGGFKALRSIKNRYGSTNEVAIFEMMEQGLVTVDNPSQALLAERQPGPGSVVLATMEGSRPLLVEVQALVTTTVFGYPKRTAVGFDLNRLNLLAAVLTKRAGLNLANQDIYVNIVGGLKITEPAADLAIVLSIASALRNHSLKNQLVAFGEVGLNGEVRSVNFADRRLSEARKTGFTGAVGPTSKQRTADLISVKTITEAVEQALES